MSDKIDLNKVDHTGQTVTLGTEDEPILSLMRGHVTAREYVLANHAEGWGASHGPLTEEEIEAQAKSEENEIEHIYGVFHPEGTGRWSLNVEKCEPKAEPITVRYW